MVGLAAKRPSIGKTEISLPACVVGQITDGFIGCYLNV
jgi:hypothetical protein